MMKHLHPCWFLLFAIVPVLAGCNNQARQSGGTNGSRNEPAGGETKNYTEGTDYLVYERVRVLDKNGFSQPVEAYSVLLPKGWTQESEITWTKGTTCDGTSSWMKATSADGKFSIQKFPVKTYGWNDDQALNQINNRAGNCTSMQPMEAEPYLRKVFAPEELGDPEVVSVQMNKDVVAQMAEKNEAFVREMQQYGAGRISFNQTAVNADVRWPDGTEGFIILGVNTSIGEVPNIYNGTSNTIYTMEAAQRIVFKYPKGEKESARNQFAAIMSSIRTNPAWVNAVNSYWKQVRQQSNAVHQARIRMNDELTRSMGNAAIKRGQDRLNDMDLQMRSWEQQQSSQDRMHTNFVKAIREVDNFKDATGTYEMSSSYNHAWSRGDGNSFVMSNNPNFDPQFVFKDQNWQQMKKVD
ncbi:MAG: hypothetical protein INR73_00325 [Williamsia sp.]|nr:hypothetical protein [Williamsia sp.]